MKLEEIYDNTKNNALCHDLGADIINSIKLYGLGVLPKADLEALIFHSICNAIENDDADNISGLDYSLMQMLRISPSKLRSLRVTRSAKYLNNLDYRDSNNKRRIFKALMLASIGNGDIEKGKIQISISDPHVQNLIERMIEDNQGIVDHSINSKLLTLSAKEFLNLIDTIYGKGSEDAYAKIIEGIKDEVKENKGDLTKENIIKQFKKKFDDTALAEFSKACLASLTMALQSL